MQQKWTPGRLGSASGMVTKVITHSDGRVVVTLDTSHGAEGERTIVIHEAINAKEIAAEVARLMRKQDGDDA